MQALSSITKYSTHANTQEAIDLLKKLIAIPSFSGEEHETAGTLQEALRKKNIAYHVKQNNVWAYNKHFDPLLPTLLLNSHHDTVRPNLGYTKDPFLPEISEGKLFGLGSNDAGASLVSVLATFQHFYDQPNLKYNLIFCASAEEEVSGPNGIACLASEFQKIDLAIVGEPTGMQMAIAEKGLMVLDCIVHGTAGHAAREEGVNAIYKALENIEWFRNYKFPKISDTLGQVKMSVTMIGSGVQHNMVPDKCHFTVDVRTTDAYSNEEALQIIREHVNCEVVPRSLRLQPSSAPLDHPFMQAGVKHGLSTYGSPTLSDQALMPWPSVKIGPGDSARSHTADEFVYVRQIEEGIALYIKLLNEIIL